MEEEEAYTEEHKEIGIATLTLIRIKNSSTPPDLQGPATANSGLLLLKMRPYVASIEGIITQCSQPFGKELTKSDVNETQSRLLINKADALNHIYPLLGDDRADSLKKGVQVKVFNEQGKVYKMKFKRWSEKDKSNVLTSGWMAFVNDMVLECEVDYVTLWAFLHRQTGGLCFFIAVRRIMNGVGKRKDYCVGSSSSSGNS